MPILEIRRDSGYADRLRAYGVVVDGVKIGAIRNGETKQFPVSAGQHELRMKMDWCGSAPAYFDASEGRVVVFQANSAMRGAAIFASLYYATFGRNEYIDLIPVA